jgi:aspartyl protease family protein
MMRHSIAVLALLYALPAAADVELIGTFEAKAAILSIDSSAPKTVKVGQTFGSVTVLSVEKDRATVDVDGKRRILVRGQTHSSGAASGAQSVTLSAGAGGHFVAEGLVNSGPVRFIVDTGATTVALPGSVAGRLGIDYHRGTRSVSQTANGQTQVYLVRLDSVRIGGIELQNVDAVVFEEGLSVALLGMSFLNRVEMRQESGRMTMTRRF